jgi:hypothetical protein
MTVTASTSDSKASTQKAQKQLQEAQNKLANDGHICLSATLSFVPFVYLA